MIAYFEYFTVTDKKQTIFVTEIVKIVGIENFIGFPARKMQELGEDEFQRRYSQAYILLKPIKPTDLQSL